MACSVEWNKWDDSRKRKHFRARLGVLLLTLDKSTQCDIEIGVESKKFELVWPNYRFQYNSIQNSILSFSYGFDDLIAQFQWFFCSNFTINLTESEQNKEKHAHIEICEPSQALQKVSFASE